MELPTSNRKKLMTFLIDGTCRKNYPFSIFWKVISRKPLDLHHGKCSQNFFRHYLQLPSVPNFIEIGGVTRKPLVDLTRNDPFVRWSINNPETTITINEHYKHVLVICNLNVLYNNVWHGRN